MAWCERLSRTTGCVDDAIMLDRDLPIGIGHGMSLVLRPQRERYKIVSLLVEEEVDGQVVKINVPIQVLLKALADQFAPPLDPQRIQKPRRVVLHSPESPPWPATVRRQGPHILHVKPDHQYGSAWTDDQVLGSLYTEDFFEVLACRWILQAQAALSRDPEPKPPQEEEDESSGRSRRKKILV